MSIESKEKDLKTLTTAGRLERVVICRWAIPIGYDDIFFTQCGHNMMFDHGFPDHGTGSTVHNLVSLCRPKR